MKSFKHYIIERRKLSGLAASTIMGAAMAAPPPEELPQLDRTLQGLASAEHRGKIEGSVFEYDPSLYVRTGAADPSKPKSVSSAYGPFQFTKTTIEDLSKRHTKIFSGSEDYVTKFTEQGKKMIQSPTDPKYGYKGSGDLSGPEYHEDYMDMSRAALSAMAKDIGVNMNSPLTSEQEQKLMKRFRGLTPDPTYQKAYQKGVNIPKPEQQKTPKPEIKPEEQVTPTVETSDYDVKSGDTLGKIAKQQNKSVEDILRLNPDIIDPNRIKPGQKIKTK